MELESCCESRCEECGQISLLWPDDEWRNYCLVCWRKEGTTDLTSGVCKGCGRQALLRPDDELDLYCANCWDQDGEEEEEQDHPTDDPAVGSFEGTCDQCGHVNTTVWPDKQDPAKKKYCNTCWEQFEQEDPEDEHDGSFEGTCDQCRTAKVPVWPDKEAPGKKYCNTCWETYERKTYGHQFGGGRYDYWERLGYRCRSHLYAPRIIHPMWFTPPCVNGCLQQKSRKGQIIIPAAYWDFQKRPRCWRCASRERGSIMWVYIQPRAPKHRHWRRRLKEKK
eukprot:PhF_6_TR11160/c0_g1_i8/m.17991